MSLHTAQQLVLGFHPELPVVVEVSIAQLSSDAGLLVFREFDEQLHLTQRFADALEDQRDPRFTQHALLCMVRQRVYGLLANTTHDRSSQLPVRHIRVHSVGDADHTNFVLGD